MFVAGNGHHIRPVCRCHGNSCDLSAGDVEGGGAFLLRALDAGAAVLTGTLAVAEHTLLQGKQEVDFAYPHGRQIPNSSQMLDIEGLPECYLFQYLSVIIDRLTDLQTILRMHKNEDGLKKKTKRVRR